ncbi:DUF6064 family protein [Roseibium aggregatum]|uniref:Uncharacterized protein n=1 Tax=Roseibium aggregatum TaxID=187304 RepID=A0A926S6M7_9HYPH|nr:DUF6064 family protein [Roseibium aggregatum]MBD1547375.1 hypothetical protein [Roseibium aggregatum]
MPFTAEEFFGVFAAYNGAIWPFQIVTYGAGLIVVLLIWRPSRGSDLAILLMLAAMWAVNGIGYQYLFFSPVNPVAKGFAAVFVVEALLLAALPLLLREWPNLTLKQGRVGWIALVLILYALIGYPVLGYLAGHRYPAVPMFGVAPCPTAIFTIGVLLLGEWKVCRWLLILPVVWAAIGGSAAVLLSVPQDYGLLVAGLIVVALALTRRRLRNG